MGKSWWCKGSFELLLKEFGIEWILENIFLKYFRNFSTFGLCNKIKIEANVKYMEVVKSAGTSSKADSILTMFQIDLLKFDLSLAWRNVKEFLLKLKWQAIFVWEFFCYFCGAWFKNFQEYFFVRLHFEIKKRGKTKDPSPEENYSLFSWFFTAISILGKIKITQNERK